jgi:hypothetical protein
MNTLIHPALAKAQGEDLLRSAAAHRRAADARRSPLKIRPATPDDAPTLQRLAELDSSAPLSGRVLLAELDGELIAAVALESGASVADPFLRSADVVHMLRMRRYQILRRGGGAARAWARLRRLAPA